MRGSLIALALLVLAGCNLDSSNLTPVPTPDIPRVEFLFPDNNSTVIEGADLTLDILARDEGSGIAQIELLLNGQTLRTASPQDALTLAEFRVEMNWFAQGVGRHVLSVIAYRGDGVPSDEARLVIEVIPPP